MLFCISCSLVNEKMQITGTSAVTRNVDRGLNIVTSSNEALLIVLIRLYGALIYTHTLDLLVGRYYCYYYACYSFFPADLCLLHISLNT